MSPEVEHFRNFVAWVLVFLPIIDWTAVYIIGKAIRAKEGNVGMALKERFTVACFLAITVSLNAFIGLVVILGITLPPGVGIGILGLSLIMVTAPNLYWLYLYSWNKFKN